MPIDHARAKSLFLAAADLLSAEQSPYLDRECGDDAELRARVEALLKADAPRPDAFADTCTFGEDSAPVRSDTKSTSASEMLIAGRYTLVELIGEGGMGSVWRAKQTEPVKRFVAIKLIKAGMDSKQVVARFEAERQALALMDHPNIAKVLDGGLHEHRPYFVMELVKGVPITEYCDAHQLPPRERLALFVSVCNALQHAHQKGIIHRDMKPSNVLVALYDDQPVVKVIDFGVAKATGGTLTEQTIDTGFGGIVGTPQYMSPEQATFNNLDIDTRTDVYALGVLLYELLTGSPPFSKKELEQKGLLEILRVVREEEPPRPSTKLSTAEALPSISANRATEPKKLTGLLRHELDWIVMKALEKDRTRRYETANGFAADVQRYLAGEAVQAHPPSRAYRLRKFVRRHRGQVIAAALVLFVLLAGVVGTTLGLLKARQQTEVARGAASDHDIARQAEEQQRRYAEGIADFVTDDFLALTSIEGQERFGGEGLDRNATLLDLLHRAAKKLQERKNLDPRIEAQLCWIIGVNYRGVGEAKQGLPFLQRAVELLESHQGANHRQTLHHKNSLLLSLVDAGQFNQAMVLGEATLQALHEHHPDDLLVQNVSSGLGHAYLKAGQRERALALLEAVVVQRQEKLGPRHPDTLLARNNLAAGYSERGQYERALTMWLELRPLMAEKLGAEHRFTLRCMNSIGGTYIKLRQFPKATALLLETLALVKAKFGVDHPDTWNNMSDLAYAYRAQSKFDQALALYEEVHTRCEAKLRKPHHRTHIALNNLAECYTAARQFARSQPLHEAAVQQMSADVGRKHPDTLTALHNLAACYQASGQFDLAIRGYEELVTLRQAEPGMLAGMLLERSELALCYLAVRKRESALAHLEEAVRLTTATDVDESFVGLMRVADGFKMAGELQRAVAIFEQLLRAAKSKRGPDDADTLRVMNDLAACYWRLQRLEQSVPMFEDLLARREKLLGRQHFETQTVVANLGVNYKDAKRFDQALLLLEESHRAAATFPELKWVILQLFDGYLQAGKKPAAAKLIVGVVKETRRHFPPNSPMLAAEFARYSLLLLEVGSYAEAEELLRECLALRERLDPESWTTWNTMSLLGGALLGQKKYAEAEPLLVKGYEGLIARAKNIPPQAATRIPESLDRLIQFYEATNKPDGVKKYKELRAAYPVVNTIEPKK